MFCITVAASAVIWNEWLAFPIVLFLGLGFLTFPAASAIKSNNVSSSEQGTIQGALFGVRTIGDGFGPLFFGLILGAFTNRDSQIPYFPAAPFYFGTFLTFIAVYLAVTLPKEETKDPFDIQNPLPSSPSAPEQERVEPLLHPAP